MQRRNLYRKSKANQLSATAMDISSNELGVTALFSNDKEMQMNDCIIPSSINNFCYQNQSFTPRPTQGLYLHQSQTPIETNQLYQQHKFIDNNNQGQDTLFSNLSLRRKFNRREMIANKENLFTDSNPPNSFKAISLYSTNVSDQDFNGNSSYCFMPNLTVFSNQSPAPIQASVSYQTNHYQINAMSNNNRRNFTTFSLLSTKQIEPRISLRSQKAKEVTTKEKLFKA